MKKIKATISALGRYLPERILTNKDLEKMVETSDEWIQSRTGIIERHIATADEAASDMGIKAFEDLYQRFKIDPGDLDLIVVATITPDMFFPSTTAIIQNGIGAKNAWGFDISAACSGFIYALDVARTYVESGEYKKVLVVSAEKMSAITDYTDRNTCVLFGDAATAVLLEPTIAENEGIIDSITRMDGSGKDHLYMSAGGSRNPATHATVQKRMHFIRQEGRTVFKFAVSYMADVTEEILERNGYQGKDVQLFVPHQANKRIIDASARRLKLREEQVLTNIDKYANTTAATIPLGLIDAMEDKRIRKGDLVVLAAFGAGFTWGATLLKWGINHD